MPAFAYTALDESGQKSSGVREAADMQAAAAELRAASMYVLEITPTQATATVKKDGGGILGRIGLPITTSDRIQFLRQMQLMLRSGLPLLQALDVFANQRNKSLLCRAVRRIADRIQAGQSFSSALTKEPGLLPPVMVKMISIGETSGELDMIMERMADHLQRKAELKAAVTTSLAYPVLLIIATIGIIIFLVTKIIPLFLRLLAGKNIAVPPTTQILIDATNFVNNNGIELICGTLAVIIGIAVLRAIPITRRILNAFALFTPVAGKLLKLAFMGHFCRMMAIMLKSGIPVLDALKVLRESVPNKALAKHVDRMGEEILSGKAMSNAMRTRMLPTMLPELIAVGEVSGTLDAVLFDAATCYETELKQKIKLLASLFEPLMILIVGGLVGFVYIAFFSVLYQTAAGR